MLLKIICVIFLCIFVLFSILAPIILITLIIAYVCSLIGRLKTDGILSVIISITIFTMTYGVGYYFLNTYVMDKIDFVLENIFMLIETVFWV